MASVPLARAADTIPPPAPRLRAADSVPPPVRPARPADAAPSPAPIAIGSSADTLQLRLVGVYLSDIDPQGSCTISSLGSGVLDLRAGRWSSVGYFVAGEFFGVQRLNDTTLVLTPTGAPAWVRAAPSSANRVEVTRWVGPSPTDVAHEGWMRTGSFGKRGYLATPATSDTTLPKFGEYVFVEELPEPLEREKPIYPEAARRANIEGTVVVQALVGKDGRVKNTLVVKSIPQLDDAAVASVVHWVFKPASAKGKPVAVWVAIPVGFRLK